MEEFELEPGEQVMVAVRKHWLVFAMELLPFAVVALAPFLILFAFGYVSAADPELAARFAGNLGFSNPWVRFFFGLWWLFSWMGAFNVFTRYFLDQWIITSVRILDIHQQGSFRRHVSSFLLAKVQDVTTDVDGIFPTLFGFGSLRVETAGDASQHFVMAGIRDPQGLRDLVMREIALLHGQTQI